MLLSQKTLFHSSISGVLFAQLLSNLFQCIRTCLVGNHLSFCHIIIKDTSCSIGKLKNQTSPYLENQEAHEPNISA